MSTTTEPVRSRRSRLGATGRATAIALFAWFGAVVAGTVVFEPTADVIVLAGGRDGAMQAVGHGPVRLVDLPAIGVRARGERPGFVAELYRRGAWLVLPARAGGCTGRLRYSSIR